MKDVHGASTAALYVVVDRWPSAGPLGYFRHWHWQISLTSIHISSTIPSHHSILVRLESAMSPTKIIHLASTTDLDAIISKSNDKLTVSLRCSQIWATNRWLKSAGHRFPCNLVSRTCIQKRQLELWFNRCGPCHAIAPTYEALSKRYLNVNFLKCDVDAAADVAARYSISAMQVVQARALPTLNWCGVGRHLFFWRERRRWIKWEELTNREFRIQC